MYELIIISEGLRQLFPLNSEGPWRIGRSKGCEIRLTDRYVSSEHAILSPSGEMLMIRMSKGTNPIRINNLEVKEATLRGGDRFKIGKSKFVIVDTAAQNRTRKTRSLEDGPTRLFNMRAILAARRKALESLVENSPSVVAQQPGVGHDNLVLAKVFDLLRDCPNTALLAEQVLTLARERLNAENALVVQVNKGKPLEILSSKGFPEDADITALISTSVLRRILDEAQAVIIGDDSSSADELWQADSVKLNKIRAIVCTPVFDSNGVLSHLLYVENRRKQSAFTSHDVEFLIWVGQIFGLLADNLQLRRRLEAEVLELKDAVKSANKLVADSPIMLELLKHARRIAGSNASTLVLGESGTGKECIARLLHRHSSRADRPFVAVNCGAIPEGLFESELFGHKKGAFSGASSDRTGLFREADGGSLFLDEIGELPLPLQTKLLRVIQEKRVRPVGADRDYPADVRIICATNRDLNAAMLEKGFREDLYYRIATVKLHIPPLRERREDIISLARHFAHQFSDGTRTLSADAENTLRQYDWPGNVRELKSCIEQAIIWATGVEIQSDELCMQGQKQILFASQTLADLERKHIMQVMKELKANRTEAAKVLGIARSTLILKLKQYGL